MNSIIFCFHSDVTVLSMVKMMDDIATADLAEKTSIRPIGQYTLLFAQGGMFNEDTKTLA